MAPPKRKRDSTDSAIADMSSSLGEESFQSDSNPQLSENQNGLSNGLVNIGNTNASVSQTGHLLGFYGDYGTAASMRPRRQTQSQAPAAPVDSPAPKRVKANKNAPTARPKSALAVPLHPPSDSATKGQNQSPPLDTLRRSARKRRPSTKAASTKQAVDIKEGLLSDSHLQVHPTPEENKHIPNKDALARRNSLIVHFKLPNSFKAHSMSFSSSNDGTSRPEKRQISPEDSSAQQVNSSFASTNSDSLPYQPDQFAQPQQAPVPLDSQDLSLLNSSQSAPCESEAQKPREPIPPVDSDAHHVEEAGSMTQPNTIPTLILPLSQGRASQVCTLSSQVGPASQSSTVATVILSQPPLRNYVPPPASTLSSLSDMDSDGIPETDDDATIPFDLPNLSIQDPVQNLTEKQLYDVVDQLFAHRIPESPKPRPVGDPPVWADGRQELCETLHYFRSYQSACYCTGGFVRAFMFDKVAHSRDYIDSNVVISRAGGGLVKDKDSGEMRSGRDQVEDTVSQALRNCMRHYNPVVVITGVDNPHIPSKPPHQYCVMDYFKPTHIWVEKSGNSKIVRYRFEKLNAKKESWWRAKDVEDPIELGALPPPLSMTCSTCNIESPQIYLNGWMCLQPSCPYFWHIAPSTPDASFEATFYEPDEDSLTYDPRFLKQSTPWPNDRHDYPMISNDVEISGLSIPGEDTSQAFWLGMVCPKCGRCNSRVNWMGWKCLNPDCDFTKEPPHTLIPAVSLREPLWPVTDSYTLSRDIHAPLIIPTVTFAHGYRINRYEIPGIDGFITHMVANKTVLEEPGGPDSMFEELQQTDIGLARRPLPNGQLKGDSYTRHFLVNYGMPYKFIAATSSRPFTDAARPITATRSRLNWAASYLLSQEPNFDPAAWKQHEFNEVLALGYFEAQKINYHDDGEFGLGPTIATLSLGAPGTMRIRMKARHYHGVSSAGVYDNAPPLPGCEAYDARLALQPELEALREADPKAWRARLKEVPKSLKLRSAGNARDVLKMELGHGDVVVMHGEALQRYYEHAVEHAGKLRFALTCRYIEPESLAEADRPNYVVGVDEGNYNGSLLGVGWKE